MARDAGQVRDPTRGLVVSLVSTTFLLWLGGSAILPLLPAYLRNGGVSPTLIGIVMSSYYLASFATQYPAGWLSDRIDQRIVMLAGLGVFCAGSVGFALTAGAGFAIAFRGLQGIGAGATVVAAAGMIGATVPLEVRGRAFGALYGSQMFAFAIGPLVGSAIGASSLKALFVVGGLVALLGSLPILVALPRQLSRATRLERSEPAAHPRSPRLGKLPAAALGTVGIFVCAGLLGGVYEACWSLLLRFRHASSFEIGLSWTLYALPFAALSVPAGRLAERVDRRRLAIGATLVSAGFALYYPFARSVEALIGLGAVEAIGAAFGAPAAALILSEAVATDGQGAAQGVLESARTAAIALGAAVSGALFGVDRVLPFACAVGVVVPVLIVVGLLWRHTPGRIGGGVGAGAVGLVARPLEKDQVTETNSELLRPEPRRVTF